MHKIELTYKTRAWAKEWIYALVIDRFHDGKDRVVDNTANKGYGSTAELRRFYGGTFKGVTKKLSYIKDLGCTCILLTPFLENNLHSYHGYAIQDFLKPDARFGTLEELHELVTEAHALDLRVVIDVVLNHTGNNWSYKKENAKYRKGKSYAFSHWHHEEKPYPIVLRDKKMYSKKGYIVQWDRYPESWDGDLFELKDLAWNDEKQGSVVLETMLDIYMHWANILNIDGFRLDALKHIPPHMARIFCMRLKEKFPVLFLIGEVVGDEKLIDEYKGLDAYLNYPFYFKWNECIQKKAIWSSFSKPYNKSLLAVNFLDNHDQIGLEPKRRIGATLTKEGILVNLFLVSLMPGIVSLYYGTEQALADEGEMDHDIRSSMFDASSNLMLFDDNNGMYKKIREMISFAKALKDKIYTTETLTLKKGEVLFKVYNRKGDCLYLIQYIEDDFISESLSVASSPVYKLSGQLYKKDTIQFMCSVFEY